MGVARWKNKKARMSYSEINYPVRIQIAPDVVAEASDRTTSNANDLRIFISWMKNIMDSVEKSVEMFRDGDVGGSM